MICVEKYKSKNDEKETLINQDWKKVTKINLFQYFKYDNIIHKINIIIIHKFFVIILLNGYKKYICDINSV